ncbi:hypothetical protein ACLOJK_010031 [Asimina triloba]
MTAATYSRFPSRKIRLRKVTGCRRNEKIEKGIEVAREMKVVTGAKRIKVDQMTRYWRFGKPPQPSRFFCDAEAYIAESKTYKVEDATDSSGGTREGKDLASSSDVTRAGKSPAAPSSDKAPAPGTKRSSG